MPLHRDIHWIGRQWAVTGHGMQLIDQKLKGFFDIEAVRLWEDTLIETMRAKEWLNVADFEKGLEVARKRFPAGGVTPSSPPPPPAASPPPAQPPLVRPAAPAQPVASMAVPEARPVVAVTPVAPASLNVPTAPVITSIKPAKKARAIAPIADLVEQLDRVEPEKPAPAEFWMRFPGHGKFVRPWRVRMKE